MEIYKQLRKKLEYSDEQSAGDYAELRREFVQLLKNAHERLKGRLPKFKRR